MNRRQRKLEEKRRKQLDRERARWIKDYHASGSYGFIPDRLEQQYEELQLKLKAQEAERARREREMLANPPVFSECVNGYRAWRIDAYGELRPISAQSQVWLPGVNTATCVAPEMNWSRLRWQMLTGDDDPRPDNAPRHHAPAYGCDCGLYGWSSPSKHADGVGGAPNEMTPVVTGSIAAWGDLMVHAEGFRAEHACVTSLAIPEGASAKLVDLIDRVADKYGVGVVEIDELEVEASKYGTPLPDDAKPEWKPDPITDNPFMPIMRQQQLYATSYTAQLWQTYNSGPTWKKR